jgi:hypothetical protein
MLSVLTAHNMRLYGCVRPSGFDLWKYRTSIDGDDESVGEPSGVGHTAIRRLSATIVGAPTGRILHQLWGKDACGRRFLWRMWSFRIPVSQGGASGATRGREPRAVQRCSRAAGVRQGVNPNCLFIISSSHYNFFEAARAATIAGTLMPIRPG